MELRFDQPNSYFRAKKAGAGLSNEDTCDHGSGSIKLHFFDDREGDNEGLCVLVPPCAAPDLFGAVIALVEASNGSEVADSFVKRMFAASDQTALDIAARLAENAEVAKHCCEASYRTGGREHTCTPDADSTS